jgi:flavin-dependent dehydrogenase
MTEERFDVIFMGGGVAASLSCIPILRQKPDAKIAIIEQSTEFPKKVGESASDVTALHLRRLDIWPELDLQLRKSGLRFFFNDGRNDDLSRCSDYSSPSYLSIANGFQFQRSTFDQSLLERCEKLGAKVFRPAAVVSFEHVPFDSRVTVKQGDRQFELRARWLVDASGRRGLAANKYGWREMSTVHPTSASWSHFTDLKSLPELDGGRATVWADHAVATRQNATTHFCDKGYWVWHIPLSDNTVSLGIVYDKRIRGDGWLSTEEKLLNFFKTDPVLGRVVEGSTWKGFWHLPHCPYTSKRYVIPGLALVGDAAAFVDPLFSPGIELSCQQSMWVGPMIARDLETGIYDFKGWRKYEKTFSRALKERFFVYEGRYHVMGDYEAFALRSQLDLTGYYAGIILPASIIPSWLKRPARFVGPIRILYRAFSRRMVNLAQQRERLGITGPANLNGLSYSLAKVPPTFLGRVFHHYRMGFAWLTRYLAFEARHFAAVTSLAWKRKSSPEAREQA